MEKSKKRLNGTKIIKLYFVLIFCSSLIAVQPTMSESRTNSISINDDLSPIENAMNLTVFNQAKAQEGLTFTSLRKYNATTGSAIERELIIFDMNGNIKKSISVPTGEVELVNSTTVMWSDGNVTFWNINTGDTEVIETNKADHHDIEYNPKTDTFLILGREIYGTYDALGIDIEYDSFYEVDRQGNELWYWNGSEHIPFDEQYYNNETRQGKADWLHGNSLFWNTEEDMLYYNARHIDTFFKIDKKTGEIVWSLGRAGNLTLYNKENQEVDTLHYHAHSLEQIAINRFILYDNDYYNLTNADPSTAVGNPQLLEIEVDEGAGTAKEIWSWTADGSRYFSPPWGDADRLPNGNTLGTFGWGRSTNGALDHPATITEVTQEGEIVWEMAFEKDETYEWSLYRSERFLEKPIIQLRSNPVIQGNKSTFTLSTWNTFRTRYHSNASLEILEGTDQLREVSFQFNPHWQETVLSEELNNLEQGEHTLKIIVTNSDGISQELTTTITIGEENSSTTTESTASGFLGIFLLPMLLILIFRRQKKMH